MAKSKAKGYGSWTKHTSKAGNVRYKQGSLTLTEKEYNQVQRMSKKLMNASAEMSEFKSTVFSNYDKQYYNADNLKGITFSSRKEFNAYKETLRIKTGQLKNKYKDFDADMRTVNKRHYRDNILSEIEKVYGKDSKSYKWVNKLSGLKLSAFMKFYDGDSLFNMIYQSKKYSLSDEENLSGFKGSYQELLQRTNKL